MINTRNAFDRELKLLHMDLIEMASMVQEAIKQAVHALLSCDRDLAKSIMQGDDHINDMEKQIESRCLSLIIRQQPVAGDLRKISSSLKMITDLERIGDHASDIAEISLLIKTPSDESMLQDIQEMAEAAIGMVHKSIESFVNSDLELAKKVINDDDIVDELFCKIRQELKSILKRGDEDCDKAIDILMISKYLERIGDHAVNICEWVLFSETGMHKDKKIM